MRRNSTPDPRPDPSVPEPNIMGAIALRDLPTPELLNQTVAELYVRPAWSELQRRLVERALPDLERSIRTGAIFARCAQAGCRIRRRSALQRHPYPQEIAAEAVEDCLQRFKTKVLPAGQWDPTRGVTLEDFFASCCLSDVANRWRWHSLRARDPLISLDAIDVSTSPKVLALTVDPSSDPAATVAMRDLVAQTLAPLNPDDRRSFEFLSAGWSPAEVCLT